jgi:hypothetical protein
VVSEDGVFSKDYTVRGTEVNSRIYVDADAGGDNTGVSWANAFRSLTEGCAASEKLPPGLAAELWIAEGTYRPSGTGDKTEHFRVRGNTGYYGGFAGTETAKTQRNPGAHPVVITGDLGGGVYSEHLFMNTDLGGRNAAFGEMTFTKARAFTATYEAQWGAAICIFSANSIIVTNGIFEDLSSHGAGGAIFASRPGSVSLTGCAFTGVQSRNPGGAVCVYTSVSVSLTDCDFTDVQSQSNGGAVYASGPSGSSSGSVTLTRCNFTNIRSSQSFGGAVAASSGSVSLTDCVFTDTQTPADGGAVFAEASGSVTFTRCDFTNIRSESSGGAVVASGSGSGSVTFTRCNFTNIRSQSFGGAVYTYASVSISLTDCVFTDTQTSSSGGAVYASSSGSLTIMDCGFENIRGRYGGAAYARSAGSVVITDCTFENIQGGYGGAAYAHSDGSVVITDCTFENTRGTGGSGGAVMAIGTTVNISGVEIKNSSATWSGGGLSAQITNGGTLAITGYTSTGTTSVTGGSLNIFCSDGANVSVTDAAITNSTAENGVSGGAPDGGGGIFIYADSSATAVFSGISFRNVKVESSNSAGGAIFFERINLTITNCSIEGAATDNYANNYGGAIGGAGPSSCVLSGVSFINCFAPQGSILYGRDSLSYTVRPGCSVDGKTVTLATMAGILTPAMAHLVGGSTITWAP